MLAVLSPAKSLDYESVLATKKFSEPRLLDHSEQLVNELAQKTPENLAQLMGVSPNLAELNFERFQNWEIPFAPDAARPALLAFDGDVYQGLNAVVRFGERDFTHAQKTIRILSGLYGLLRPLDLMLAYRLEMGTKLPVGQTRDLYHFWGEQITELLNKDLASSPGSKTLINLASNEYFKSVKTSLVEGQVISPRFLDRKPGAEFKVVSFFAKRARGAMAGWIVKERVKSLQQLQGFSELGYKYDPAKSHAEEPVFTRTN